MIYLCVTPERKRKTTMMMLALAHGWGEPRQIVLGEPPDDGCPFAVWGQEWLTLRIVPDALRRRRPFYHLDNGYWFPARGTATGYYRICYRGLAPILMDEPEHGRGRMGDPMKPWRKTGSYVVLAIPGRHFGLSTGANVDGWIAGAEASIRQHTDRPIRLRPRDCQRPLVDDLRDAWALVTHSSNVATEAVREGVPVFVAETSPAAPVGNLDLRDIERPAMPDRAHWYASLMSQQFSLAEMRDGTAYRLLSRVRAQVDGERT